MHELVIALMLGLIGGVIPGPVITSVFTEILQSGYSRSLRIILIGLQNCKINKRRAAILT